MSFIDDNLMAGERVVYRTQLHWAIFIMPIVLTLTVVFAIIGIPWLVIIYIAYKSSEFAVTNKRVLIKVGLIRRESLETLLQKVEGIHVEQDILGRIFNYGTIIVKGTGGTSNPFKTICSPFEFRKIVQEQVEKSYGQQGATEVAGKVFCRHCGEASLKGSRFCSRCGKEMA